MDIPEVKPVSVKASAPKSTPSAPVEEVKIEEPQKVTKELVEIAAQGMSDAEK